MPELGYLKNGVLDTASGVKAETFTFTSLLAVTVLRNKPSNYYTPLVMSRD